MGPKKIPISVAARLLYHLGEQLISDEFVALLELIKNSYDADATKCIVKVDTSVQTERGFGCITIEDNGNGMLPSIVYADFLRLATDYKKVNKISPYYKRRALGEKGLGRLSYQRLGKLVQVRTVPRIDRLQTYTEIKDDFSIISGVTNCIDITLDWDSFSDAANITDVFATVEEAHIENPHYGTIITIQGIRNPSFWEMSESKRRRIQDEILALINPFVEAKGSAPFNLELDVNGEKFYIDTIEEAIVDKLSDVSCHFSFDGNILELTADFKDKYIHRQKEQYLKSSQEKGFSVAEDHFDCNKYTKRNFVINLCSLTAWINECQLDCASVGTINGIPATNFVFDGSLYVVDKKTANHAEISRGILEQSVYLQKNFQRIGMLWDRISGVYMYRDQFRILPYGKNDWLGLTERSQKRKATILKQGNVAGYVHINGEKSSKIREQTNRQGILEDEFGSNFLCILGDIILEKLFDWDISVRRCFSSPKLDKANNVYKNADGSITFVLNVSPEEKYKCGEVELSKSIDKASSMSEQASLFGPSDVTLKLANDAAEFRKASSELHEDYRQKLTLANERISEYEDVIPLLGQTLIIETVSHELNRIYSHMAALSEDLIKQVNSSTSKVSTIAFNLKREVSDLDLQLNHLLPTQRYKLKDVQNIDMGSFFKSQYVADSASSRRLNRKGITCEVLGDTFCVSMSLGNLIVIFDNLVMNSEYWLEKGNFEEKRIYFECFFSTNVVRVWDSGAGVSEEIENVIFEPFQTMKREGRGLGLYIVRELLALSGASIKLLQERNRYGNRYIFEIVFQERKI